MKKEPRTTRSEQPPGDWRLDVMCILKQMTNQTLPVHVHRSNISYMSPKIYTSSNRNSEVICNIVMQSLLCGVLHTEGWVELWWKKKEKKQDTSRNSPLTYLKTRNVKLTFFFFFPPYVTHSISWLNTKTQKAKMMNWTYWHSTWNKTIPDTNKFH